jgi:NAD-dependent SIR2 family protein deacetylase
MTQNNFTIPAELLTALRSAERVTIMSGAAISAESGVPTLHKYFP